MIWDLSKYACNIAVVDEDGTSYSYAEMKHQCDKLASVVKSERCLVFNLCTNTVGSLVGYIAFVNIRIVPLLLDAHLDRELLNSLIDSYKPDYLWLPAAIALALDYEAVYTALDYTLVKTPFIKSYKLFDELALLLTTSGSTGSPKLVRQSYKNIEANIKSIVDYLDLNETERPITTLPMSYTYGLSIINSHLYVGASIIMTQKTLLEKDFWRQFREYEATSFGGVPYIYEMLDRLRFFRMQLPSLRTMTQAGGKLSLELHMKFARYAQETGKHFVVMYGQTEATARMAYLPYEKSNEKYGSIGIAIPGGEFKIIDKDGKAIDKPDMEGELVYEGANVTLGYAECGDDLNKGDERCGILQTGDIARRDVDGYYYIVGRKKRFLKIYGSRVNLDETEHLVHTAFPDMDCACSGVDDKMHVFVTNGNVSEQVKKFLADKLHFNSSAFDIVAIGVIPRNDSGKIQYIELAKYYNGRLM
jgi:long-chain acyl-CoA synthetase